ncbi:hypothetical protein PM082_012401 [Marasmius tenuissimus]|nr:hypothetical protein PM082_012401 [Marasmius tenuissimus]
MIDPRVKVALRCFTANASTTYRTSRMAVNELRKLGYPPASVTSPILTGRMTVALNVLAVLLSAYDASEPEVASLVQQIQVHWRLLSLWIKHLVEVLILSEDEPLSPQGVAACEHVLILLPSFLEFPPSISGDGLAFLLRQSPFLPQLIVQVWFRVLEIHHWTYGMWSYCLQQLAASDFTSWFTPISIHDHATQKQGLAFIRHIDHQLQRLPTMSLFHFREFVGFVGCPSPDGSTPGPLCPYVPGQTLPVLVRLLSVLIRKRKQVRTAAVDSAEYELATCLAWMVLTYIYNFAKEPHFSVEALDAGILYAIFKAHACFLRTDNQTTPLARQFYDVGAKVIDSIARLLLFPAILHRFWKARSKIERSFDEEMARDIPILWESWNQAREKASGLHEFRLALKRQITPLCNHAEVRAREITKGQIQPQYHDIYVAGAVKSAHIVLRNAKSLIGKTETAGRRAF